MKLKLLVSLAAVSFVFASLPVYANTNPAANDTTQTAATASQQQEDGAIVASIVALNHNEINAARLALHKTKNPIVIQFAKMMIAQHTESLNATLKLAHSLKIKMVNTSEVMQLQANGRAGLKKLSTLKGSAFDKAYINAMVAGHENALQLIDTLSSQTSNTTLQNHLAMTRKVVEHHLAMAKEDQVKLA